MAVVNGSQNNQLPISNCSHPVSDLIVKILLLMEQLFKCFTVITNVQKKKNQRKTICLSKIAPNLNFPRKYQLMHQKGLNLTLNHHSICKMKFSITINQFKMIPHKLILQIKSCNKNKSVYKVKM